MGVRTGETVGMFTLTLFALPVLTALAHGQPAPQPTTAERPPWVVANYLREMCQAPEPSAVTECDDYLRGFADALGYLSGWKECFVKADNTQLRLAFLLYASQHPDELTAPAAKMVKAALIAHFPCQKP